MRTLAVISLALAALTAVAAGLGDQRLVVQPADRPIPPVVGETFTLARPDGTIVRTGRAGATLDCRTWPPGPGLLAFGRPKDGFMDWRDVWVNPMDLRAEAVGRRITVRWSPGPGAVHVQVTGPDGAAVASGWRGGASAGFDAVRPGWHMVQAGRAGQTPSLAEVWAGDYARDRRIVLYHPLSDTTKRTIGFSWDREAPDGAYHVQIFDGAGRAIRQGWWYDTVAHVDLPLGAYRWRVTPFTRDAGGWRSGTPSPWAEFRVVPDQGRMEDVLGYPPTRTGRPTQANLAYPEDAVRLPDGAWLVADSYHHVLKRVTAQECRVVAGTGFAGWNGDGPGREVHLNRPSGLEVAPDGTVFVADSGNRLLRRFDPRTGRVSTLLGVPGADGATDDAGRRLDDGLGWIKLLRWHQGALLFPIASGRPARAALYRWTGTGRPVPVAGTAALGLSKIFGFDFRPDGSMDLMAAVASGPTRFYRLRDGEATPLPIDAPKFASSLVVDPAGGFWFGGHTATYRWDGVSTTTATSGHANVSRLRPDGAGGLLIVDSDRPEVSVWTPGGERRPVADNSELPFVTPIAIVRTAGDQARLLVNNPPGLFALDLRTGATRKLAGNGRLGFAVPGPGLRSAMSYPAGLAADPDGNVYIAEQHGVLRWSASTGRLARAIGRPDLAGLADGASGAARFKSVRGLVRDPQGRLWIADTFNDRLAVWDPAAGRVRTAGAAAPAALAEPGAGAGAGPGLDQPLNRPHAAAWTSRGLVVADSWNNFLRVLAPDGRAAGAIGRYNRSGYQDAGAFADGPADEALFSTPKAMAEAADGRVYVADQFNHRIRRWTPGPPGSGPGAGPGAGPGSGLGGGWVETVAGDGRSGYAPDSFNLPNGLAVWDPPFGPTEVFVCDTSNGLVRRFAAP